MPNSKSHCSYRTIVIQNRMADTKFLHKTFNERFPNFKLVIFESIIAAFHEIVHSEYDLVLIDSEVEGFENFSGIKLLKAFNDNVPIIVTCTEANKFTGLKSVVEGADNYFIIRHNYQNMFERIISLTLNLTSHLDLLRNYEPDQTRELVNKLDLKSKTSVESLSNNLTKDLY